jgi:hypothetical protein
VDGWNTAVSGGVSANSAQDTRREDPDPTQHR